jgi:hypothetical protein
MGKLAHVRIHFKQVVNKDHGEDNFTEPLRAGGIIRATGRSSAADTKQAPPFSDQ